MIRDWNEIDQIKGWFFHEAALLFGFLNRVQNENEIVGDIMEIGVYHGRSAVVLGQFVGIAEKFFAIDTFNGYTEGESFRQLFEDNYKRIVGRPVDWVFPDKSSMLQPDQLDKGTFRIWHIDGYHSAEDTYNDLVLGNEYTRQEGVIIVDDFLNQDWLGVCQGLNEFLARYEGWHVFAYGYNKTFLCRSSMYDLYVDWMKKAPFKQSPHNFLPFYGKNYISFK